MTRSLYLGHYAGIKVQIHWSFWLLILFVAFLVYSAGGTFVDALWHIGFIAALFLCVVLHEFGHALTARKYGIDTRSITLLPIGGLASLKEIPEDPKEEFMIAIAGPAVNVVIAIILYFFVPVEQYIGIEPELLEEQLGTISGGNFLFYLFMANIALVTFNMLPAFPLDGGRVLRALLSAKMGRVRATQTAATFGKLLAVLFFIIGLFYNLILAIIAVFIYFGAESENVLVIQLNLLSPYKVRDAMIRRFTILHPEDTLHKVVDMILEGTERDFVVASEDGIVGIILISNLPNTLEEYHQGTRVKEVMEKNFKVLHPDDPLTEAYRELASRNTSFFPVVEFGRITGVIDMQNIHEFIQFRARLDY